MSTKFAPTSWYRQWGLIPRATCKIRNLSRTRAAQVTTGEWLAIGPRRACPGEKKVSIPHTSMVFALRCCSPRFASEPLLANDSLADVSVYVHVSLRAHIHFQKFGNLRASCRTFAHVRLRAAHRAAQLRSCTSIRHPSLRIL